jgi:hypothetical protein
MNKKAERSLLIPDAGPLISLWKADSPDFLLKLRMPIVVVDAVCYEIVINPDKYEADKKIGDFLFEHAVRKETNIGKSLLKAKLSGDYDHAKHKHGGEMAIMEFMFYGLDDLAEKNIVLLLFEDHRWMRGSARAMPKNVHLLSTVGFFTRT